MAKINDMQDFNKLMEKITYFSHAYLFETNSLDAAFPYVVSFAKEIICGKNYDVNNPTNQDICYKIDHNEFDDLYIVNPDTIGINVLEISKLLDYMKTKSLREDGKRVYIVYGMERLTSEVSNKILKFLEEPNDNIFALLITENVDKILSTIISRCQVLNITFADKESDSLKCENMKQFFSTLFTKQNKTIAYVNNYFDLTNRVDTYDNFLVLEKIISENINHKYLDNCADEYLLPFFDTCSEDVLVKILDITNQLKGLIKKNNHLNLLIDRYIIEVSKELSLCKKS